MLLSLIIFLIVGISISSNTDSRTWGYAKSAGKPSRNLITPEEWHTKYADCQGDYQSPINIDTLDAVYDEELEPIEIKSDGDEIEIWRVTSGNHNSMCKVEI
jgi:carbonic anhydrase